MTKLIIRYDIWNSSKWQVIVIITTELPPCNHSRIFYYCLLRFIIRYIQPVIAKAVLVILVRANDG